MYLNITEITEQEYAQFSSRKDIADMIGNGMIHPDYGATLKDAKFILIEWEGFKIEPYMSPEFKIGNYEFRINYMTTLIDAVERKYLLVKKEYPKIGYYQSLSSRQDGNKTINRGVMILRFPFWMKLQIQVPLITVRFFGCTF